MALFDTLLATGMINADVDDYEAAEEALRRAQHIAHRHEGVYTRKQLPVIDKLTDLSLSQDLLGAADREQRFLLKISEQEFGEQSEELLPVLQSVGSYFAQRGEMIPQMSPLVNERLPSSERKISTIQYRLGLFRESVKLYRRAIQIIEDTYGPNDLRLVQPLQGLAEAWLRQGTSNSDAEDSMERALEIVETNPASDLSDHARALVRLGDVYTRTSDPRADDVYLEAWNLLVDQPELLELRDYLFGVPTRIYPEARTFWLTRKPMAAGEDEHLFADVEYTVRSDGRVGDVEIVDANIANDEKSLTRSRLKETRFRPRIVNGEIVDTPGLILHQTFEVMEPPEPVARISVSAGPES